ncbi:MAG: hypothetical protein NTV34_08375 [Proteobacteria bacterium]|nr:hypothetical protein [Pseudomonadota bacterium]
MMTRMRILVTSVNALHVFFAMNSFAAEVTSRSRDGRILTLTIGGDSITQNTSSGTLCANSPVSFQKVKLWMPEHGHGSSPTSLTTISDVCATVDKINFSMPGIWELKIAMADGDLAVISAEIR